MLVYKRGKGGPGRRPVCRQPVFPAGEGADENSLISVPGGLIAENNYGYELKKLALRQPTTTPGLVRIRVDYRHGGCRIVWHNDTARVPSSVIVIPCGLFPALTPSVAALSGSFRSM